MSREQRLRGFCHHCDVEVEAVEILSDNDTGSVGDLRCSCCEQIGFVEKLEKPDASSNDARNLDPPPQTSHSPGPHALPAMFENPGVMASALENFLVGVSGALRSQGQGPPGRSPLDQFGHNLLGAMETGIQNAVQQTQGLCEEDRQWVHQQGSALRELASGGLNFLQNAGPLAEFLNSNLGRNWQEQQSGLSEAAIRMWVDQREIPTEAVAPGGEAPLGLQHGHVWTCPICMGAAEAGPTAADAETGNGTDRTFSSADATETNVSSGLCLVCDSDGSAWHVFHKECACQWLMRSATCPICRRELNIRMV
eukprot:TRINITY_DN104942_c0_g1_i1.p1 TRINITY_DN104942_c0_g1~~TRINITY_DN104942_c0_g1_i1.p1  ORF type:complete len:310 (+),score=50.30 TRINITY_DN104942_c0_g1_i1:47-976(+)